MARIRRETYQNGQVTVDEVEVPDELIHEQMLNARVDSVLPDLRVLVNTTGTLTNTQVANGLRLVARVLIAIIRLHLRRFDGVD